MLLGARIVQTFEAVLVRKMGGFEETRRGMLSISCGIDVVRRMEKCTV